VPKLEEGVDMAKANPQLIQALLDTADRLADPSIRYQWTHQGACNCGHLAQTVTKLSRAEIHEIALERAGDWSEHAVDYCPGSQYPIDHVISTLLDLGLNTNDLVHLERLNNRAIVADIPKEARPLKKNNRDHVVLYLRTWAAQLQAELDAELPAAVADRPAIETRVHATIDGERQLVFSSRNSLVKTK
jgi:hypothetical protein